MSELDIVEAIIGWAGLSTLKNTDVSISSSPWRIAEARHLFRYANVAELDEGELKVIADVPGVRLFPDFLRDIVSKVNYKKLKSNNTKTSVRSKIYQSDLIQKRSTFFFKIKVADLISESFTYFTGHFFRE